MIFDSLENLKKYKGIPNLEDLLEFIQNHYLASLPEGDIAIKGKELYVKVLHYLPKEVKEKKFETHKLYADIQVIIKGSEKILLTNEKNLHKITDYDSKDDYQLFSSQNDISELIIGEKEFVVFFPGEAHMPGCLNTDLSAPVIKLVFKSQCG
ncbi:MAG: YhcH/YjgK/YiaL family protein [Candidatus Margulisiibacteriota bacterium]